RDEEPVHSLDRGHRVFPPDEVGERQLAGGERLEVDAGLKRPARAGHDDHAHVTPGGDRRDRVAELRGEARIARVQHVLTVEGHAGDRAPHVLAIGALCLTSGGGFPLLVVGRLLMGLGQALSMMGGLTAILRFQSGRSLASALNAYELSAMIGMLGGVVAIGALPSSLPWDTA